MAVLDPTALERELEALRRQRDEASQRVRASRQPLPGPATQGYNKVGEAPSGPARPPLGNGRFGADRGFGGPPPAARGDGPRATGSFRDGSLPGRLGSGPSPRGPPGGGFQDGPPRGRFEGGPGGRGAEYGEHGRDRDGGGAAASTAAQPPRRRAVLSMVVSDRPTLRVDTEDKAKTQQPEVRDAVGGDADGVRDRDPDRDRRQGYGEDRARGWGRGDGAGEEERYRGNRGDDEGRGNGHGYGSGGGRGVKRPADEAGGPGGAGGGAGGAAAVADDPDSRKRARRLLGRALLGTLQKFRQEDAQFQASDAAARRAELARKAEGKATAETERLRRQAAEERSRKRQEELESLMDLNLATDIKVLELLYAKKLARRRALATFLRADGVQAAGAAGSVGAGAAAAAGGRGPSGGLVLVQPQPVYWAPASHCAATLSVKERQEKELREWEESVLADLELEKDGLRMRAQARRLGITERRQRAAETRASGRAPEGAAAERREGGDAEAMQDREAMEAAELEGHHEEEDEEEHGGELDGAEGGDVGEGGSGGGGAEEEGAEAARGRVAAGQRAAADADAHGGPGEDKAMMDATEVEAETTGGRDDSDSGAGEDVAA